MGLKKHIQDRHLSAYGGGLLAKPILTTKITFKIRNRTQLMITCSRRHPELKARDQRVAQVLAGPWLLLLIVSVPLPIVFLVMFLRLLLPIPRRFIFCFPLFHWDLGLVVAYRC